MSLRYCNALPQSSVEPNLTSTKRRLAILMAWMLAKETHIEKYRKLYFRHGFDVLTVKTSPFSLIFPTKGSQIIAKHLLDYLKSQMNSYPNVVVHGFSVGGYQFGEMLVQMNEQLNGTQIDAKCDVVRENIKGMVFDSAVDFDGIPYGFSRALTDNNFLANTLQMSIQGYMNLFYYIATKHYLKASKAFFNTPLRCPALLLVSHGDKVGDPESNLKVANKWREMGIDVQWKCWDDSRHVSHMHKYPDDYSQQIDNFLRKINLSGLS
ncbi:transmembrane protein 53-B-like protein [Leptotrombidium deliense]|uniref:Transmembrane protein 53-B-like protein n=1 Tax=Leptotrombidium deliense TaxID=299467 RepID=A0A443SHS5_9ACAR|nr:transmembrane protein 53-B-like protein [Leptotrombidium deliense]